MELFMECLHIESSIYGNFQQWKCF